MNVGFADIGEINSQQAYESSFGNMPDHTPYSGSDYMEGKSASDWRPSMSKRFEINWKAFTSDLGGDGSTDKVMVPIFVDQRIIDISRKYTPMVELVARVSNLGLTADFNTITAKGAANWGSEDQALSESDDSVKRDSFPIKFLRSVGRVTGVAQAAVPSFMLAQFQPSGIGAPDATFADMAAPNARQLRILTATRAIKEKEEDTLLNGDSSSDPLEPDGIIVQIAGVNDLDKSAGALALNDLHDGVRLAAAASGRPNLAVCNTVTYTTILKLLSTQITFREASRQVFWGFSAIVLYSIVGEIPIIFSQFLSDATNVGRIMFLDLSVIETRVLQDLTFETLAKTSDSDKFFLKMYICFIVRAPSFNSQVINIQQP